jgi:hypothetical protein
MASKSAVKPRQRPEESAVKTARSGSGSRGDGDSECIIPDGEEGDYMQQDKGRVESNLRDRCRRLQQQ